ncbi:MAG: winged helix-turn-helix domain-containing protein [Christensenellales bacterium]
MTKTALRFTLAQARRFLLLHQGLLGEKRFTGKQGALDFVRQAGCIQFDPIDICGRNADLVLQSRVGGYDKQLLHDLLYTERQLVDYFDKELSIFSVADWPSTLPVRERHRQNQLGRADIQAARAPVLGAIQERGPLNTKALDMAGKVAWYWGPSRLARAALEYLYASGDVVIHHKIGTNKFYDLPLLCLPADVVAAPDPLPDPLARRKWQLQRRIGSLGLMWDRASAAWLGIADFGAQDRHQAFSALQEEGLILPAEVAGLKDTLYLLRRDLPMAEQALAAEEVAPRCELIAPLDNLIWDRPLLQAIFGFQYTWEMYTPPAKRRYGCYVLPLLYGEEFIGRIQPVFDRKKKILRVENLWFESGIKPGKAINRGIEQAVAALEAFNRGKIEA